MFFGSPTFIAAAGRMLSLALLAAGVFLFLRLLWRGRRGATPWHIPEAVARLQARSWQPLDAVVLLAALLLPALLENFHPANHAGCTLAQLVPTLLYYLVVLTGVVLAARRTGMGIRRAFGITRKNLRPSLRAGIELGLAALPVLILVAGATAWLLNELGLPYSRQEIFNTLADPRLDQTAWLMLLFIAVVLGPVVEEAIFRGIFFPTLLRNGGLFRAMLLVNALFALLHLHGPSFLPLLAVGICFSLGMLATGSLLTSILMHAIFNGEMILLFYAWPALAS